MQKQNKRELLIEEAEKMHLLYPDNIVSLEWICKIYNESFVEKDNLLSKVDDHIREYCEELLKLQPDSSMAVFTKSILLFKDGKVADTEALLRKGFIIKFLKNHTLTLDVLILVTAARPGLLHAWILLAECCNMLHMYKETVNAISRTKKLLMQTDTIKSLQLHVDVLHVAALSHSSDVSELEEAVQLCENVSKILLCFVQHLEF